MGGVPTDTYTAFSSAAAPKDGGSYEGAAARRGGTGPWPRIGGGGSVRGTTGDVAAAVMRCRGAVEGLSGERPRHAGKMSAKASPPKLEEEAAPSDEARRDSGGDDDATRPTHGTSVCARRGCALL